MGQMNGGDFLTGSILGQILALNHEQIRVSQTQTAELMRVRQTLETLPAEIAAAMPQHRSLMERLGISTRQLVLVIVAASMALVGALDGKDIKEILLAQLGLPTSSGTE